MNKTRTKLLSFTFFFLLAIWLHITYEIHSAVTLAVLLCGPVLPVYLTANLKEFSFKGIGFKNYEKDFDKDFKDHVDSRMSDAIAVANKRIDDNLAEVKSKMTIVMQAKLSEVAGTIMHLQQQIDTIQQEKVCSFEMNMQPQLCHSSFAAQCPNCCSLDLYADEHGPRCASCCEYVQPSTCWSMC